MNALMAPASAPLPALTWDAHVVLQLIEELLLAVTAASGVAIAFGDRDAMQCVSSMGIAPLPGTTVALTDSLSGQAVRSGRALSFHARPPEAGAIAAAVLAPVLDQGRVVGLLAIFSTAADGLGPDSLLYARQAAGLVGGYLGRAESSLAVGGLGWGEAPLARASEPGSPPAALSASTTPGPVRHLTGLPCPGCGAYPGNEERNCAVCGLALDYALRGPALDTIPGNPAIEAEKITGTSQVISTADAVIVPAPTEQESKP